MQDSQEQGRSWSETQQSSESTASQSDSRGGAVGPKATEMSDAEVAADICIKATEHLRLAANGLDAFSKMIKPADLEMECVDQDGRFVAHIEVRLLRSVKPISQKDLRGIMLDGLQAIADVEAKHDPAERLCQFLLGAEKGTCTEGCADFECKKEARWKGQEP